MFVFEPYKDCKVEAYLQKAYEFEDMDNRYLPSVVIVPGGCYEFVADREAFPVAKEYYHAGYNVFILYYATNEDAADFKPLIQLLSTIDYIRKHKEQLHTNGKVAVCGFSAGGHLACSSGTLFNEELLLNKCNLTNVRPDALILSYPVILANEYAHEASISNVSGSKKGSELYNWFSLDKHVDHDTPPCFIWTTSEDELVPCENSLMLALALSKYDIPYELHIFPHGPHGMSVCTKEVNSEDEYNGRWVDMSIKWLNKTLDFRK